MLGAFEKRVLRKVLWPERDEVTGEWKDYLTRRFMRCAPHQILFW